MGPPWAALHFMRPGLANMYGLDLHHNLSRKCSHCTDQAVNITMALMQHLIACYIEISDDSSKPDDAVIKSLTVTAEFNR